MEMYEQLINAFIPIKINKLHVYTDSMVIMYWVIQKSQKFEKIERKGLIINNQLDAIVNLCERKAITFHHIEGFKNPADFVTRIMSYKVLSKTNYFQVRL